MMCPNCESESFTWYVDKQGSNSAPQNGRLAYHDILVIAYLGCNECSETLRIIDATEIEEVLNSLPLDTVLKGV